MFICVFINNRHITLLWETFFWAKNTKTDFTDVAMLTRGVELGPKEHNASVVNTI